LPLSTGTPQPSAFVATSRSSAPNPAFLGPNAPWPRYLYYIDAPGGIDVAASLLGQSGEHEVTFLGGIRTQSIGGVREIFHGDQPDEVIYSDFIPNENYAPHTPNDGVHGQPVAGPSGPPPSATEPPAAPALPPPAQPLPQHGPGHSSLNTGDAPDPVQLL